MTGFCLFGDDIVRLWMGPDYVLGNLIPILGAGYILPFSFSPIGRILIGMNLHGRAALLSIASFSITALLGALFIFASHPTLDHFALMLALSFTVTNGVIVPGYAIVNLKLEVFELIRLSFIPVAAVCVPAFCALWLADRNFSIKGLWVLPAAAVYALVTGLGYWFVTLSKAERDSIYNDIFAKKIRAQ